MQWQAAARALRDTPSAVLLLVQLLGVLLYPFVPNTEGGGALLHLFGLLVIGVSLRMVRQSPAATPIAVALAVAVASLMGLQWWQPDNALFAKLMAVAEAGFYLYATLGMIAYMMADDHASIDEYFAAGASFTLLAWAFAHLCMLCQLVFPGAFSIDGNPRSWMDCLFLSFTTLSGVGLGDVIPLNPQGKALIMLGEFAGVMYLAMVVSRLIAMSGKRKPLP